MDSSAVEMLRSLVRNLSERGITLVFSGTKRQVLEVMERTGLVEEIGVENFFDSERAALSVLVQRDK